MDSNFLVYQAYGHPDILNEALISIASVYGYSTSSRAFQIVLYTDSASYFQSRLPFDIQYVETPLSTWQEWKGEKQFVHRAKIKMLQHFVAGYSGNILYCDTDTYFLQSPFLLFDQIQEGYLLMHTDEGILERSQNLVFKKLDKFLRKYKAHSIPPSTHMWNAGVLGFSSQEKGLLDQVAQLSDDLYNAYPKHVMEQLSFSFYFQQKKLKACEESIFHYWDFKEYRIVLKRFFEEQKEPSFEGWSKKVKAILPMELIQKKRAFMAKPSIVRKWLTFIGKGLSYA
jgi:hypothetical protein